MPPLLLVRGMRHSAQCGSPGPQQYPTLRQNNTAAGLSDMPSAFSLPNVHKESISGGQGQTPLPPFGPILVVLSDEEYFSFSTIRATTFLARA